MIRWLPLVLVSPLAWGAGQLVDPQTIAWDQYPEPARVASTEVEQCWGAACTTKQVAGTSVAMEPRTAATLTVRARALPSNPAADQPSAWASIAYTYPGAVTTTAAQAVRAAPGALPGTVPPAGTATSIWAPTAAPKTPDGGPDDPVELGVKFRSDVAGAITGVRFYKSAANTGTHTAALWTSTGTRLATATFVNETASGWQQANFVAPVAITAGATYTASYHASAGHYAADQNAWATEIASAPLRASAGVYAYGSASAFPTQVWNGSNYWVDVVFAASGP